ncbi:MAG: hypothetical protein RLZZ546_1707, partial [Bacteroidota bacterium]
MSRDFKHIISVFLCLLSLNISFGQFKSVVNYGIDQGLPNGYVYDITQDNQGYIWLGTGDGLVKMDESSFEKQPSFSDKEDPNQLVNNILYLNDDIWFTDKYGSIYRNSANRNYKIATPFTQSALEILAIDKQRIAFVSGNEGIFIYDTQTKLSKKISLKNLHLQSATYGEGKLILASDKGLVSVDIGSGTYAQNAF